jgi:hypothetical protein
MHAIIDRFNRWRKRFLGMRQNMPVYDEEETKEANKEKSTCRGLSVHPYFLLSVNFLIARLLSRFSRTDDYEKSRNCPWAYYMAMEPTVHAVLVGVPKIKSKCSAPVVFEAFFFVFLKTVH